MSKSERDVVSMQAMIEEWSMEDAEIHIHNQMLRGNYADTSGN